MTNGFKRRPAHRIQGKPTSGTIINEIVAFLNTCDGSVYVGIKDDGTVVGIADIDKTSLDISNIIADQIEPSSRGLVSIETPIIDGKQIVRVDIRKGSKLYYIKKIWYEQCRLF